jgi:phosphoribosylaminoimidazole-succinocarboxamide synthase
LNSQKFFYYLLHRYKKHRKEFEKNLVAYNIPNEEERAAETSITSITRQYHHHHHIQQQHQHQQQQQQLNHHSKEYEVQVREFLKYEFIFNEFNFFFV